MPLYSTADALIIVTKTIIGPIIVCIWYGPTKLLLYALLLLAYYFILRCVGYESLTAMDEFFLLDSKLNRANVITVIKMEKI